MKRLPKMWRKKNRAGRQVGNWLAKVAGDTVNLGTKDAELARTHLREAVDKGRREFTDEIDVAAAALGDIAATPPAAPSVQDPPPPAAQVAPGSAPPAASAPFAALPPLPTSQPPPDPQDFADTAAAASEAADAAASATPGGGGGGEPPNVPPDVLDGFLLQGAGLIVDMQLGLQGALIRRTTGRKAGSIPPDAAVRGAAAEAWLAQLKIWFPADTMLPPWAMAVIVTAMAVPVQVATSTEIPEDEREPTEAAA